MARCLFYCRRVQKRPARFAARTLLRHASGRDHLHQHKYRLLLRPDSASDSKHGASGGDGGEFSIGPDGGTFCNDIDSSFDNRQHEWNDSHRPSRLLRDGSGRTLLSGLWETEFAVSRARVGYSDPRDLGRVFDAARDVSRAVHLRDFYGVDFLRTGGRWRHRDAHTPAGYSPPFSRARISLAAGTVHACCPRNYAQRCNILSVARFVRDRPHPFRLAVLRDISIPDSHSGTANFSGTVREHLKVICSNRETQAL